MAMLSRMWDRDAQELWIYVALIIVTLALYVFKDYIKACWTVLQLKGPPTLPILGNAKYICRDDILQIMSHSAYKDYGPVTRVWISALPFVVLMEPEDLQTVLSNPKHTRKIFVYRMLDNFLGKGLLTSEVHTWRAHRRILQPAFHLQVLQQFLDSFAESADRVANRLLPYDGQQINITGFINDTVYEILNETVFGVDLDSKMKDDGTIDLDDLPFRKGQMVVLKRIKNPWLLIDWIYQFTSVGRQEQKQRQDLLKACRQILDERKKIQDDYNGDTAANDSTSTAKVMFSPRKMSLLKFMLELSEKNRECFSDEDIIDECCTFMLAGQDSVGAATAITLFLLATHPEWQDKCVQELDEIFGAEERAPTMQDLKSMRVLDLCIKETLRLYPSVPVFGRTLGEDIKIGKRIIPAGCDVIMLPYTTHRLPHHFPDPHSFRPERFSPENSEKRHPYAYIPFSAGPRNCIGNKFAMLEMKAMISAILRKFHLGSVEGKTEVRPRFRFTLRASGGLWVKLTRRVDAQ